jgi:hypothetical protein
MTMDQPLWHAQDGAAALAGLHSDPGGLADEEAVRRLQRYGPNRLAPSRPASAWRILGGQFVSVVVFLLAAAALVSLLLVNYVESAAIGAVLRLNTAIGFVTELRARRAMESVRSTGFRSSPGERAAGCDNGATVGPSNRRFGRAFALAGGIRERKDDRTRLEAAEFSERGAEIPAQDTRGRARQPIKPVVPASRSGGHFPTRGPMDRTAA